MTTKKDPNPQMVLVGHQDGSIYISAGTQRVRLTPGAAAELAHLLDGAVRACEGLYAAVAKEQAVQLQAPPAKAPPIKAKSTAKRREPNPHIDLHKVPNGDLNGLHWTEVSQLARELGATSRGKKADMIEAIKKARARPQATVVTKRKAS